MKKLASTLFFAALVLTACTSVAQPTPTNVPPPAPVLAWNPCGDTNATYTLYWGPVSSNAPGFTNYQFSSLAGTNLTASVAGLAWGSTNSFNVTASDNGLTSAYGGEITFVMPLPPPAPGAVTVVSK